MESYLIWFYLNLLTIIDNDTAVYISSSFFVSILSNIYGNIYTDVLCLDKPSH